MNNIPPELQRTVEILLSHGGLWLYLAVAFAMFIEYVFPPFPGDLAIFAAGFISGEGGASLALVMLAAFLGACLGLSTVYYIGNRYGRRILEKRAFWFLSRNLVAKTEAWYEKAGERLLLISKFLPGVRFALVFFAGIANMPFKKAFAFTATSCLIWNSMVILLATYLRQHLDFIYELIKTYSRVVFVIILVMVLVWFVRFILQRRQSI